jgi:hypothetical protein
MLHENKNSMISRVFESQRRNRTAKDWVTTVLLDIKEINLDIKFEDIRKMKKGPFVNVIKRKVEYKSFKYLENIKETHSKVKSLKHPVLKMQPYQMKKEECQVIFQMRSQVTNTKMNQKHRYNSYECEACGQTDESKEHVTNCNVILEMHNEWKPSEIPKFEKKNEWKFKRTTHDL